MQSIPFAKLCVFSRRIFSGAYQKRLRIRKTVNAAPPPSARPWRLRQRVRKKRFERWRCDALRHSCGRMCWRPTEDATTFSLARKVLHQPLTECSRRAGSQRGECLNLCAAQTPNKGSWCACICAYGLLHAEAVAIGSACVMTCGGARIFERLRSMSVGHLACSARKNRR